MTDACIMDAVDQLSEADWEIMHLDELARELERFAVKYCQGSRPKWPNYNVQVGNTVGLIRAVAAGLERKAAR